MKWINQPLGQSERIVAPRDERKWKEKLLPVDLFSIILGGYLRITQNNNKKKNEEKNRRNPVQRGTNEAELKWNLKKKKI